MPKELARVMARYDDVRKKATPLLHELHGHETDYVLMRDRVIIQADELAERLTALKVKTAADPRAANDPGVQDSLEYLEKYKSLMADRQSFYTEAAKKAATICTEIASIEKDVAAVIKAKSGFFTRSKSLPQLKALAVNLHKFGDDLQTASAPL